MKACPGGKRTRIRAHRPNRKKRKYKMRTEGGHHTAAGGAVFESCARENYPVEDWKYEVANGDTVLGYSEWVQHRKESEK